MRTWSHVESQSRRFSPEVRERAVRLVREQVPYHTSRWAAIAAIAPKVGCTQETWRRWVRHAEQEAGERPSSPQADAEQLKALERENRKLKRTNEILCQASAFFAAAGGLLPELDRLMR